MLVLLCESGIILRSRKRLERGRRKTDSSFLPVFQPACLPACLQPSDPVSCHLLYDTFLHSLLPCTLALAVCASAKAFQEGRGRGRASDAHRRRRGKRGGAKISPPHSDHTGFGREGPLHNRGWRRRRGGKDTELLCKPPSLPLPIMALAGGAGNSSPRRRRRRHSCSSNQPAFSKNLPLYFQSIWDARFAYGERFCRSN